MDFNHIAEQAPKYSDPRYEGIGFQQLFTTSDDQGFFDAAKSYVNGIGVRLTSRPFLDLRPASLGAYNPDENSIYIKPSENRVQMSDVLMHELAHIYYERLPIVYSSPPLLRAYFPDAMEQTVQLASHGVLQHFNLDNEAATAAYIWMYRHSDSTLFGKNVISSAETIIRLMRDDLEAFFANP